MPDAEATDGAGPRGAKYILTCLGIGLLAATMIPGRVSLEALLFGDVLAVGRGDVALVWGVVVVVAPSCCSVCELVR